MNGTLEFLSTYGYAALFGVRLGRTARIAPACRSCPARRGRTREALAN